MSAPAPVAAVQSGFADVGETVADVLGEVMSTGIDVARDIVGNTAEIADDLFHSAAGALGFEQRRKRRGLFGKLVVAAVVLGMLGVVFSVLRRMRGGADEPAAAPPASSGAAAPSDASVNGTNAHDRETVG